jgi:GT2 family glycosyltransferase
MMDKISATVIIAFYKRLDFLEKIFEGLEKQSKKDFEVIIAEDNDSPLTPGFIGSKRDKLSFQIKHVSQEDIGFRKNRILNEAVKVASAEILIFLDGDCIPHKHFIMQYCKHVVKGTACFGRRVMLGKTFTANLLQHPGIRSLRILSLLFSDSRQVEDAFYLPRLNKNITEYRGIWGCNWGLHVNDLIAVNGFDEDYVHASVGEDNDIEWRLRSSGIKFKSLKHKAIVYHMYHRENYNEESFLINNALFETKKKQASLVCLNGLNKTRIDPF